MSLCFFLVTFRNVFIMSSVLLELAWFVFYFQFKSMLHCNKMTTQGNSIQWIKGEGFCFKLLSCLWKCMCLLAYVEWLNKHVKLIKGGEPWWFQRPTSHSVLSPSLVARPSSSSDFCQVLHEYPLPPPEAAGAGPALVSPGNIHYSNNFSLLHSFSLGEVVCCIRLLK